MSISTSKTIKIISVDVDVYFWHKVNYLIIAKAPQSAHVRREKASHPLKVTNIFREFLSSMKL